MANLLWEDEQMAKSTIVALWLDVAIEGPASKMVAEHFREQIQPSMEVCE